MSEVGGVLESRSVSVGDQLPVQRPAPLKHGRANSTRGGGDTLKHILDSVPFTPSQGVRTPSPRSSAVRFLAFMPYDAGTATFVIYTCCDAHFVGYFSLGGRYMCTFRHQRRACRMRMPDHKAIPSLALTMSALLLPCAVVG
jgi:hypothetical protein